MANLDNQQAVTVWRKWKRDKDPQKLGQLLSYVQPTIQHRVGQFASAPVANVNIEAQAKKEAVYAMQNFNPTKGASLRTHVSNRMQKVFRYVSQRQNIGRIPEHRVTKISLFKTAKDELFQKHGRESTTIELADYLRWPPQEVARMEAEQRKDLGHSLSFQDQAFVDFSRNMETINFAYFSMTPQEQLVYDYSVGAHGKQRIKASEIARKLGVSPSQVSKIKRKISEKIMKHTR